MAENINLVLEVVFLSVICAISVLGNITLVAIFLRKRALRTIANGFLLNLAFADLLVSVLNMPVTIVTIIERRWIFGETACNFLGFTTMLAFVSSVMSLAMIAVNRYYFVVKWKTYRSVFTPRNSVIFGAIVWLISSSISIPPLFGWADYRYIPGKSYCFVFWPCSASYMYFMLAICFFGPLIVMSLSYYHIFLQSSLVAFTTSLPAPWLPTWCHGTEEVLRKRLNLFQSNANLTVVRLSVRSSLVMSSVLPLLVLIAY